MHGGGIARFLRPRPSLEDAADAVWQVGTEAVASGPPAQAAALPPRARGERGHVPAAPADSPETGERSWGSAAPADSSLDAGGRSSDSAPADSLEGADSSTPPPWGLARSEDTPQPASCEALPPPQILALLGVPWRGRAPRAPARSGGCARIQEGMGAAALAPSKRRSAQLASEGRAARPSKRQLLWARREAGRCSSVGFSRCGSVADDADPKPPLIVGALRALVRRPSECAPEDVAPTVVLGSDCGEARGSMRAELGPGAGLESLASELDAAPTMVLGCDGGEGCGSATGPGLGLGTVGSVSKSPAAGVAERAGENGLNPPHMALELDAAPTVALGGDCGGACGPSMMAGLEHGTTGPIAGSPRTGARCTSRSPEHMATEDAAPTLVVGVCGEMRGSSMGVTPGHRAAGPAPGSPAASGASRAGGTRLSPPHMAAELDAAPTVVLNGRGGACGSSMGVGLDHGSGPIGSPRTRCTSSPRHTASELDAAPTGLARSRTEARGSSIGREPGDGLAGPISEPPGTGGAPSAGAARPSPGHMASELASSTLTFGGRSETSRSSSQPAPPSPPGEPAPQRHVGTEASPAVTETSSLPGPTQMWGQLAASPGPGRADEPAQCWRAPVGRSPWTARTGGSRSLGALSPSPQCLSVSPLPGPTQMWGKRGSRGLGSPPAKMLAFEPQPSLDPEPSPSPTLSFHLPSEIPAARAGALRRPPGKEQRPREESLGGREPVLEEPTVSPTVPFVPRMP